MQRSIAQALSGRSKSVLAANYREHAAELRELAAFSRGDELDQELLDLAQEYDALAEMAEEPVSLPELDKAR